MMNIHASGEDYLEAITYLYRCESGGTSDEASVMGVEQQPLVGRLVSLPVDKTSVIK